MTDARPVVGIVMGSDSDLNVMPPPRKPSLSSDPHEVPWLPRTGRRPGCRGLPYRCARGLKVIVAGAGCGPSRACSPR